MRQLVLRMVIGVLLHTLTTSSQAQGWEAVNPPLNLFNGTIYATHANAQGLIYAGGGFKNGNNKHFVAVWNGIDWTELGNGATGLNANGSIFTLASYGDTVYAAGAFTNRSSQYYVAKWNGSAWSELDRNSTLRANDFIYSVAVDRFGNVYAAGRFTDTAGKYYVAKWDGTAWRQLGTGANALNANQVIYSLAVDTPGNVYAAGYFTNAADKKYVAKWNGTSWSELGTGTNALNANDYIRCLATDASGHVYAGGSFRNSSGECYLAKWNGSSWTETGTGAGALHANSTINTVAVKSETELYVAGIFNDYGGSQYVARWNGVSWSQVDNPEFSLRTNDRIESISIDATSHLYAGGKFLNKSGQSYVATWNGAEWSEMGGKGDPFYTTQPIYQLVGDSVGNVYVAGNFQDNGGWYYLQHWNGKTWKQLSTPSSAGFSLSISGPHPMVVDKNGILYVTGRRVYGTNQFDCVLTWDGVQWRILEDFPNSLGAYNSNVTYGVRMLQMDPQGNLYVAGDFLDPVYGICSLAKWDGKTWTRLQGSAPRYIKDFCVARDGNIYAFGDFTDETGKSVIAIYNAAKHVYWAEVKSGSSRQGVIGMNIFSALATDANNNLYVNGNFTNTAGNRYIAKWDGSTWSEMGVTSSLGLGLAVDRYNNIYTNKDANTHGDPIKKWNGTSWVSIGMPLTIDILNFSAGFVATDATGNVYSNAGSPEPRVGSYIVRLGAVSSAPPKLSSFTPARGSVGTAITITGKNLSGTAAVSFGGTDASSFMLKNDSTITAIVANGSTGRVKVKTAAGEDSLQTFTYTCDSVKGPVPVISLIRDSVLVSSTANYYQWYFNNNQLSSATSNSLVIKNAGFYHVETSAEGNCWNPSLDYPVLIGRSSTQDSLQLYVYPNPSTGNCMAYVKLPQVTTATAYVQVFDVSGVLVFQTSKLIFYGNEIRIPITIRTKGTYFVKMIVNNKSVQQSIIIM